MITDSFIIYVKTDDFYKDISNDINKWFDTSNYSKDIDRSLEKGMNKKVLGKFKDELGSLVMSEFCGLRAKTYSFLIDGFTDDDYGKNAIANKKAKGTKKCVVKRSITFNDYVNSLFNDEKVIRSQFLFRSHNHQVYTEKINKIALSSNDDKRIQTSDKITTYPHGYFDNDHINNTKSELDIFREDAQALRNKSKVLREETHAIIKESHAVKDKLNKKVVYDNVKKNV